MTQTPLWRQTILEFEIQYDYANPFKDVTIKAYFTGPSGLVIIREAYWDGARSYKVSFAPTELGTWCYSLEAEEKTGLNNLTGELECVEYKGALPIYQHGFLRVHPSRRYLTYNDGTPFFWLGDTHWEFAYKERFDESNHPHMDSMFKGMANKRVEQGFTVYQTNLRSDAVMGGDTYYWSKTEHGKVPNITFYQQELDRRMYYLADLGLVNALGFAWFMSILDQIELQKDLARYMIARYGALPIVWTLAGETAGYGDADEKKRCIDGWREVALYVEAMDSYNSLQTAHYTNERPFASYYQEEAWFDFTLNQAGHGDYPVSVSHYREFLEKYSQKPFIESECFYEFCSTLEENGTRLCTADMLRRVAYLSIQLGGCGYTYGAQGIWDNVWEKGQSNLMKLFNRYDVTWYEAIEGIGAVQMGYMKKFYEKVHFEELYPYQGEKDDQSGNPFGKKLPLITITKDAKRAVLYYADTARKKCNLKGLNEANYSATWFDPRTGNDSIAIKRFYAEGGVWEIPVKPDEGDWLLLIEQI